MTSYKIFRLLYQISLIVTCIKIYAAYIQHDMRLMFAQISIAVLVLIILSQQSTIHRIRIGLEELQKQITDKLSK